MVRRACFLLLAAILILPLATSAYAFSAPDKPVTNIFDGTISGKVYYDSELEGGYYGIESAVGRQQYALMGDFNFEDYIDQWVTIEGELFDGMSTLMKQAIVVSSIEIITAKEAQGDLPAKPEPRVFDGTIEGRVYYDSKLEGGYYGIDGYALAGDFDFEEFVGKWVLAKGHLSTSPSILMKTTIVVEEIVEIGEPVEENLPGAKRGLQNALAQLTAKGGRNAGLQRAMEVIEAKILENQDLGEATRLLRELSRETEDKMQQRIINNLSRQLLQRVRQEVKDSAETSALLSDLAESLREAGDIDEAIEALRGALQATPADRSPEALKRYNTLGLMMRQRGETAIKTFVNGEDLDFDVNPIIENNRTLVAVRLIAEKLGAEVQWDADNREVILTKDDTTVRLPIGETYAYVNGERTELDVAAKIRGNRTLVPLRFFSETFGADVQWLSESRVVVIQR